MKNLFLLFLFIGFKLNVFGNGYEESIKIYQKENKHSLVSGKQAPLSLSDLQYVQYFPIQQNLKVKARVEILKNQKSFKMATFDGSGKDFVRFAKIYFQIAGENLELTLFKNLALKNSLIYRNHLFLPFTDLSNGTETYKGGRYLVYL